MTIHNTQDVVIRLGELNSSGDKSLYYAHKSVRITEVTLFSDERIPIYDQNTNFSAGLIVTNPVGFVISATPLTDFRDRHQFKSVSLMDIGTAKNLPVLHILSLRCVAQGNFVWHDVDVVISYEVMEEEEPLTPVTSSLSNENKEKVVFLLGYPSKILLDNSTHFNRILVSRMDNLTDYTKKRVEELITLAYKARLNLDNTQTDAHVTQVDEIGLDSSMAVDNIYKQYNRYIKEISSLLDIPIRKGGGRGVIL